MSALDHSWVVNSNNGLHATGHPGWLQLQLATSKLLDVAVLLPAHQLPQFQMYRWAFVGDANVSGLNNNRAAEEDALRTSDFVPHVLRIARLMDAKYPGPFIPLCRAPGHLLLDTSSIKSLQDLHPFFSALSAQTEQTCPAVIAELEAVVERDFLEKLR